MKNSETQADIDYRNDVVERETRHTNQVNKWDELNDTVGGDLFDNDAKISIMRKHDNDDGGSWEDFREKVINDIKRLDDSSLETHNLDI
ncbi:hypothetical protein [Shewanella sp. S1-58-MNA-CIBAN-0166]|mgnify:CR=1 FL=1|uniref:hypothetical protein n=1 Tax=unclassified Shewanella TaxID=196818 RepID=UPI00332D89AB